jgi:hypothetical protein
MRLTLVRERATLSNRLHKALESANIKLGAVASDILGTSSRRMLHGLVDTPDVSPSDLADLAIGKLREKRDDLTAALEGRMNDHHRFVIDQLLEHPCVSIIYETIEMLNGWFSTLRGTKGFDCYEQACQEWSSVFGSAHYASDPATGHTIFWPR